MWTLRCGLCGECASGNGPMPVFVERWVCGQCVFDLDFTPPPEVFDLDLQPRGI